MQTLMVASTLLNGRLTLWAVLHWKGCPWFSWNFSEQECDPSPLPQLSGCVAELLEGPAVCHWGPWGSADATRRLPHSRTSPRLPCPQPSPQTPRKDSSQAPSKAHKYSTRRSPCRWAGREGRRPRKGQDARGTPAARVSAAGVAMLLVQAPFTGGNHALLRRPRASWIPVWVSFPVVLSLFIP